MLALAGSNRLGSRPLDSLGICPVLISQCWFQQVPEWCLGIPTWITTTRLLNLIKQLDSDNPQPWKLAEEVKINLKEALTVQFSFHIWGKDNSKFQDGKADGASLLKVKTNETFLRCSVWYETSMMSQTTFIKTKHQMVMDFGLRSSSLGQ